jgi:hypothetical protein
MRISRLTVDKLGIKLYDKVSAAIGEIVANSYDADATEVTITAPMGQYLATKPAGVIIDSGFTITVKDNGVGMPPDVINDFYLLVGGERRNDRRRGDRSPNFNRKVMGRKGIGKLAPFGICEQIEVISSGGEKISRQTEKGESIECYATAHFILHRKEILKESEQDYHPELGALDGTLQVAPGTSITLSDFDKRKVPTIDDFARQLAQRFGIQTVDWRISLFDLHKTASDPDFSRVVGELAVDRMDNTLITLKGPEANEPDVPDNYRAIGPDGEVKAGIQAGFFEGGLFYPVTGWVAYAAKPYKDDLMAGIRIYCRGKLAAQTTVFSLKAGFTGEYDVRSYLVGEMHADWLDERDDLILTDRRDILWSDDVVQAFQNWGQALVKEIGKLSRHPMRQRIWDEFKEKGKVEERIEEAFPQEEHKDIREKALDILEDMGKHMRREELEDQEAVDSLVRLGLMLAPHVTLDRELRAAAEASASAISYVTTLLKTAKIAELASYGRIAEDRVRVIDKLYSLKENPDAIEADFQKLIQEATWLINPEWSPISSNRSFGVVKKSLEDYFKKQFGKDIEINVFVDPSKRPDFVLLAEGRTLHIVEIKKPNHVLTNDEMDRIINYHVIMARFFNDPANSVFKETYDRFHITLVCEAVGLSGAQEESFNSYRAKGDLTFMDWNGFLTKTKRAHLDFLQEAEKIKRYGFSD